MADVTFSPFTFADTEIEFVARSEAARAAFGEMFGFATVSVTVRKSFGPAIEDRLIARGLTLNAA